MCVVTYYFALSREQDQVAVITESVLVLRFGELSGIQDEAKPLYILDRHDGNGATLPMMADTVER